MARWWVIGLVLVAFWLRLPGLFANHFHADEALFAGWARLIAVWRDPLLATQVVDKPPLLFYAQAVFYPLLGPVEWAARLPGFVASLLLVPATAVLAQRLYRNARTVVATEGVVATVLITFSPLAIQFSPTAFIDPLLTALLVAALLAVTARRPGWAGLWLGLALAAKYQALLFVPLLLGLGWVSGWRRRDVGRFAAGVLPVVLALAAWEWARAGELSLWSVQIGNFGGVRPAWSWELWPRLAAWLALWRLAWGGVAVPALTGAAMILLTVVALRKRRSVDLLLVLFILGYTALHWLLAIPVWDRYLLPLLPLVAILGGRAVAWLLDRGHGRGRGMRLKTALAALIVGGLLLGPAVGARRGAFALGGWPKADDGAHQVAAYLATAPYGTVLYDHWYSWQWRYHLFDTGVYVSWFPHPAALADDLLAFGARGTRWLALPATDAALPVRRAVVTAGFTLRPVLHTDADPGIILYRVERE